MFTQSYKPSKNNLKINDIQQKDEASGLNVSGELIWKQDDKFGFLLEGDALAAKQGRAEDVLAAVTYSINENLGLRAGYRLLEGGADNDEVYGFALFHYASLGLFLSF